MSDRRALVTGASGFVGPHLVRRLLAHGWRVTVVSRSSSALPGDIAGRCARVPADAGPGEFAAAVADAGAEVCFHLATHFAGVHAADDVDPMIAANLQLGTRLADALAAGGEAAFVNVGTVWQHHDGRRYGPTSLYAATKQAFADVLQFYAECTPLRVVTLELGDTYGPGDTRGKLLQALVGAARSGVPLRLSPGEQLVDMTHVADVAEALVRAVPFAAADAPAFAVRGEMLRVRELVALVGEVLGTPVPVEWGARPYRPREMMRPWTATPPLPGFVPATGLRDGLARLLG